MTARALLVLAVLAAGAGAFLAGRASVGDKPAPMPRGSYADGYRAGREDAFAGFDGGWSYATPYVVTLRKGEPGITYKFDRRVTMAPSVEYRACGHDVCTRRAP